MGRSSLRPFATKSVTDFLRDHTEADERILSPRPTAMSVSTGRPNASGFAEFLHLRAKTGPGVHRRYSLSRTHSNPTPSGFAYVHATDSWVATLPSNARLWLDDPMLFELMIRDGLRCGLSHPASILAFE